MKKYRVVLHQEYIVEAANEHEALCWAEQLGLGNEYEVALDTTVEEIEEEKEHNETVHNIYIIVDDDFDPDYYQESNDVNIEFESVSFIDDEMREKYLVTGCESELDSFLEEAKQHILDIGQNYLLYKMRKAKQHSSDIKKE